MKLHYNINVEIKCLKERKVMEDTKRYPLWMWEKLRDIVRNDERIDPDHKERLIEIIGTRASINVGKFRGSRYKPQPLPVYVMRTSNDPFLNYVTLMNKPKDECKELIYKIYEVMKHDWFEKI
jgi:hypothetical protein